MPSNHTAASLAKSLKIPFVSSPRGMLTEWSIQHKSLKKRIAWHLYQHKDLLSARVLHATSNIEAADLRKLGFQQPIAVIANAVKRGSVGPRNPQSESKIALFLSRIHPKKGLIDLIQAWAQVKPSGWKLHIVGGDEIGYLSTISSAINSVGLHREISYMGVADGNRRWDFLNNADLFVLPSHSENFGIVVAEALTCGVPVITTKATPWEELKTQNCGWWVDVGAESIARALSEATAASDVERKEMGARGQKLIESRYSPNTVGHSMKSVYEWILGGGQAPDCVLR